MQSARHKWAEFEKLEFSIGFASSVLKDLPNPLDSIDLEADPAALDFCGTNKPDG